MRKKPALSLKPVGFSDGNASLARGYQVSEAGTLKVECPDGLVEIRPRGASLPASNSQPWLNGALSELCHNGVNGVNSKPHLPGNLLGTMQWDDFKIGQVIGEGNQAKVRKVKHKKTGQLYALKSIDLSKNVNQRALQLEISRLAAAKHPNIVSSNEAFFIEGKLKVLMEYMNVGTLSSVVKMIGPIPSCILSLMAKQVLEGLGHLHENGIVHRDIKPSNLLLNSNGEVKIADFGVSTILSERGQANTQIGSTAYMSPERIRGHKHDASSDIWSVGITMAECALGVFPIWTDDVAEAALDDGNPFQSRVNMFDLSALIAEGRASVAFHVLLPHVITHFPHRPLPDISEPLQEFVEQAMQQDAFVRPRCADLLRTPFILYPGTDMSLGDWLQSTGVTHHPPRMPSRPC